MSLEGWESVRLKSGDDDALWELFHENSKTTRFGGFPSPQIVVERMAMMRESLEYEGYPLVELPTTIAPFTLSLAEAITTRVSARTIQAEYLTLEQLRTILFCAYGVTRDNAGTNFPRPFRVIPSAGALYPLEIYLHTSHVLGLEPGLYHYSAAHNHLRCVRRGEHGREIAEALVQPEVATDSSALFFITALFERTTFKYGDRGYRFALLEAGHLAQNVNLAANGLGLGSANIGGFYDRQIDEYLGLDGVTHSTLYLTCVGSKVEAQPGDAAPL